MHNFQALFQSKEESLLDLFACAVCFLITDHVIILYLVCYYFD